MNCGSRTNRTTTNNARRGAWGRAARAQRFGNVLVAGVAVALASAGCGSIDPWDLFPGDGGTGGSPGAPSSCEVDGVTYLSGDSFPSSDGCNTCACTDGGQVICTLRACVDSCGGLVGNECSEDQFCRFEESDACGAADRTGVCTTPPESCTQQFDPVCGCDDQTYANACLAHAAGVSVAFRGSCEPPPPPPAECRQDSDCPVLNCLVAPCPELACQGGLCVIPAAEPPPEPPSGAGCGPAGEVCAEGEYCRLPGCGSARQLGECATRPEACTFEYDPVCGCDGETYPNACAAASAGVTVGSSGECRALAEGDVCGGSFAPQGAPVCGEGLFCQYQPGALCGAADAPGVCVGIPELCTFQYEPVCGCDGVTYGNACQAAAAEAGILENGECSL